MRRVASIVLIAAASGCATIHLAVDAPLGDAAKEPLAGAHYYRVLDAFGPPAQISTLPDGFVFMYDSLQEIERQLGISFGDFYDVELFKLSFGRATLKPQYFVVVFDRTGSVRAAGLYEEQRKVGGSFIVQVVFTVVSTTDMSYLMVPPVQEDWGLAFTRQPPVALNASGDFGSAQAGIEARGAPTAVGQHSLEMPPAKQRVRR